MSDARSSPWWSRSTTGRRSRKRSAETSRLVAATLAYAAEWANKVLGEVAPVDGPFLTYVLREPVGVVAAIVPWNYTTSLACWKLGPALAVGCTVVLKPLEWTPLTALKLGELAREVGLPDGVLNVLPGEGEPAGEALARHPGVDKVAFTGSIRTARRLLHASADTNLKRLSLELGGKSPQIALADADFDAAREACVWGIFGSKGEVCSAGSRVLVQKEAYPDFVERLVQRARALRVGDPLDPQTEMGAQVSARQVDSLLGYVASGKADGARLLTGGARDTAGPKAKGHLFSQPSSATCGPACASPRRKFSARCWRACGWRTRTKPSPWPTPRAMAWGQASGRPTWPARTPSPDGSRAAWCGLIASTNSTMRPRSAG